MTYSIPHEHVFDHRTAATRGIVLAADDTGCTQTVDVQTHDGVVRAGVEVHQVFGLASMPPQNGGVVVLIANGGDPSDMIAMAAACPLGRLGGLAAGETAIYAADGTRVHLRVGGIIEVLAANQVVITAPQMVVTASSGITLTGDVSISGTLSVGGAAELQGNVSMGGNLNVAGNINAGGTITP